MPCLLQGTLSAPQMVIVETEQQQVNKMDQCARKDYQNNYNMLDKQQVVKNLKQNPLISSREHRIY